MEPVITDNVSSQLFTERIELYKLLGTGTYAYTYGGTYNNINVVIKIIFKPETRKLFNELIVLRTIKDLNINISKLISNIFINVDDPSIKLFKEDILNKEYSNRVHLIIFEYIGGLDLYYIFMDTRRMKTYDGFLDREKKSLVYTPRKALTLISQMTTILEILHNNGCVHRDIKPENIIYSDSEDKYSLIDFGLSTIIENNSLVGTPGYVPIFIIDYYKNNRKISLEICKISDIFALAVTIYVIIYEKHPFNLHRGRLNYNNSDYQRPKLINLNDEIENKLVLLIEGILLHPENFTPSMIRVQVNGWTSPSIE